MNDPHPRFDHQRFQRIADALSTEQATAIARLARDLEARFNAGGITFDYDFALGAEVARILEQAGIQSPSLEDVTDALAWARWVLPNSEES